MGAATGSNVRNSFCPDNCPGSRRNRDHSLERSLITLEKDWSEWQDLNLRPPRPEQGARGRRRSRLRGGRAAARRIPCSCLIGRAGIPGGGRCRDRTYDLSRVRRTLSRPPDVEQVSWKGRPVAFEAAVSVGKIFATY